MPLGPATRFFGFRRDHCILFEETNAIRNIPSQCYWVAENTCCRRQTFRSRCPRPGEQRYPPSRVGGASFVTAEIASYRFPFATSVEAFYIFDARGNLTDISVRRTIVAP